jgi:hypothetical protein
VTIPNWYGLVLLGLAAYRTWKLLAEDTILDKPRAWFVYGFRKWRGNGSAGYVSEFIACPWCLGFWTALAWWGAWQLWPHGTAVAAIPFAASAIVGLLAWFSSD